MDTSGRCWTRIPPESPGETACFEKSGGEMGGTIRDPEFQRLIEIWQKLDDTRRVEWFRFGCELLENHTQNPQIGVGFEA